MVRKESRSELMAVTKEDSDSKNNTSTAGVCAQIFKRALINPSDCWASRTIVLWFELAWQSLWAGRIEQLAEASDIVADWVFLAWRSDQKHFWSSVNWSTFWCVPLPFHHELQKRKKMGEEFIIMDRSMILWVIVVLYSPQMLINSASFASWKAI